MIRNRVFLIRMVHMKTKVLLLVSSILIFLSGLTILRVKTNRPPENLVIAAGKQLAEAKLEKSPNFAQDAFREASMYYNDAMAEWQKQNERMILVRNYNQVSELARKSMEKSNVAIAASRQVIINTEKILDRRIAAIGAKINDFEENLGHLPLSKKHREALTKSKLLYSESRYAFKNKNYAVCKSKLDSVELVINQVISHYTEQLEHYFKAQSHWDEMVRQTISESKRSQTYAVIVDKFDRKLTVYKNGKIYREYETELGANWVGDKMQQGDKSTPEGMYKVVEKKQNGQTKYHKALLLNYPNEADRQRFSRNKQNGIIEQGATIGNLIEIHGNGGKGTDWTDGCIALTDKAMDELFKLCAVGTKVTIVGSTKPLNELQISIK